MNASEFITVWGRSALTRAEELLADHRERDNAVDDRLAAAEAAGKPEACHGPLHRIGSSAGQPAWKQRTCACFGPTESAVAARRVTEVRAEFKRRGWLA